MTHLNSWQLNSKKDKWPVQKLQRQLETAKLRNALETEHMQQEEWETALAQLKEAREAAAQEHQEIMDKMRELSTAATTKTKNQAVAWLQSQLEEGNPGDTPVSERETQLRQLKQQQEELQKKIDEISCPNPGGTSSRGQEAFLDQIRAALVPRKEDKDPNKDLLRALLTNQNKVPGSQGTSTLRPELLNRLAADGEFSMAEWLASLNKQEEGESEVHRLINRIDDESDCRSDCKHSKMRSGMLDKSTANIQCKEIWPQKNLGEDWAEEEIEFKQLLFEHLVAGETRTIETCTEPAQILRRLRLLRRIAYLHLRGIEWHLLRKMYAAILSSIETREYSWESNFDRFESILYRRAMTDNTRSERGDYQQQEGRKRFCRDFNKPEGCPRPSPHTVWIGSGSSAVKRTVHHCYAACIIRDKVARDHPDGHTECPHRA